jgi:hypothetical protein
MSKSRANVKDSSTVESGAVHFEGLMPEWNGARASRPQQIRRGGMRAIPRVFFAQFVLRPGRPRAVAASPLLDNSP